MAENVLFEAHNKNFNEDRPILSAEKWATNWSGEAKIGYFCRMQRHFSDILNSNDTKTGDVGTGIFRKLHRLHMVNVDTTLGLGLSVV